MLRRCWRAAGRCFHDVVLDLRVGAQCYAKELKLGEGSENPIGAESHVKAKRITKARKIHVPHYFLD